MTAMELMNALGETEEELTWPVLNARTRRPRRTLRVLLVAAAMLVLLTLAASGDDTYLNLALLAGAGTGGLIGYLRYNHHPAQVFMGDTGSFLIGGLVAGLAMSARLSLLLPIVALAMFVSSLSDIIQIGYFKYTKRKYGQGRRVFRMAPLHHHFELGGMSENRIVAMYAAVTLALCLLALIPYIA